MFEDNDYITMPSGIFMMGASPHDDLARENEYPQHAVDMHSFRISKFLVTQKQYEMVMGYNPSFFSSKGNGSKFVVGLETSNFPVESVSWSDAMQFCKILSAASKEFTYRLPTEEEWEYACRGGSISPFSTNGSFTSFDGNILGDYPYKSSNKGPSLHRPSTVGSYAPNPYGLYDMHGNVWEWCGNHYYSYNSNIKYKNCKAKVLRGGAWNCYSRFCRASYRCVNEENVHYYDCGFRIIRTAKHKIYGTL